MNAEKLQAAVSEAFSDEPENGYRPFVIAVYSVRESEGRLGDTATGRVDVYLRPSVKHGHMVVFDTAKALFQWVKERVAP